MAAKIAPWFLPLEQFTTQACSAWKELSYIPSIVSGRLSSRTSDGRTVVSSVWSQRRVEAKESSCLQRQHIIASTGNGSPLQKVCDVPSIVKQKTLIESTSPSGKHHAEIIVRKDEETGAEIQELLVLDSDHIVFHLDLLAQKKHGTVCTASQFGVLAWSPDEDKLVLVADEKAPKTDSYFPAAAPEEKKDEKETFPAPTKGDEFLYRDNWGEQLFKYHKTILVLVDWRSSELRVLDGVPEDVSAGQAVWAPDGNGVVFVGWKHSMPRPGLIYCTQRQSALYHLSLDGKCEQLNDGKTSARLPRFSPSGEKLTFLEQDEGGPHHACNRLMMIDWKTKSCSVVVDLVRRSEGDEFPGIFAWDMAGRCWSSDSRYVVMDTQWRSRLELIIIDTETKAVSRLSPENPRGSWSLLDIHEDIILANFSSPSSSPQLMVGALPSQRSQPVSWTMLTSAQKEAMKWEILSLSPSAGDGEAISFEAILFQPKFQESSSRPLPLIIFPHGGPHSCFPTSFVPSIVGMCRMGFVVVAVNYRGSSGFGQDSIESLLGQIGTNDVHDVQQAAEKAMELVSVDRDAIFVTGGSHGGFLTAHAIGQYPDVYRAACMRNPVIDITSMSRVTDIQDWTYVEAGIPYQFSTLPSAEAYKTMLEASPIRYADKVKAPTLVLIGAKDLRVPPHEGHEFYQMLKNRGVPVRVNLYPNDSHPLDRVETQSDVFVNTMVWFHRHSITDRSS